jgi:hypothetical protein
MWSGGQSQALVALPMKVRHDNHPSVGTAGIPTEIRARNLLSRGLDRHRFAVLALSDSNTVNAEVCNCCH